MALPSEPPRYSSWAAMLAPIKRGETGWRAFALQCGLNSFGSGLTADGIFGQKTYDALVIWQSSQALTPDGIAGPATQGRVIQALGAAVNLRLPEVPNGLMRGWAEGEGANILAATNWSVVGGVDCGPMQYRVYGPPYAATEASKGVPMCLAFDTYVAMRRTAGEFLARVADLGRYSWASTPERAKRCAVLAHNWPVGARYYAQYGHAPNPTARAEWVPSTTRFPDGAPVITRQDWCEFYAMGGPHGRGAITKYVRDWT